MITYAVSDKWAEGGCTIVHTHRARGAGGGGTRKSRQHMRRLGSLGRASEHFQLFSTLTFPMPGCSCTAVFSWAMSIGSTLNVSRSIVSAACRCRLACWYSSVASTTSSSSPAVAEPERASAVVAWPPAVELTTVSRLTALVASNRIPLHLGAIPRRAARQTSPTSATRQENAQQPVLNGARYAHARTLAYR